MENTNKKEITMEERFLQQCVLIDNQSVCINSDYQTTSHHTNDEERPQTCTQVVGLKVCAPPKTATREHHHSKRLEGTHLIQLMVDDESHDDHGKHQLKSLWK